MPNPTSARKGCFATLRPSGWVFSSLEFWSKIESKTKDGLLFISKKEPSSDTGSNWSASHRELS